MPLLKLLRTALQEIDFPDPIPEPIVDLCAKLTKDEKKQHARFRYLEDHFPKAELIPVFDRQHALEDLFATVLAVDTRPHEGFKGWGDKLAYETYAWSQILGETQYRLGLLDDHPIAPEGS